MTRLTIEEMDARTAEAMKIPLLNKWVIIVDRSFVTGFQVGKETPKKVFTTSHYINMEWLKKYVYMVFETEAEMDEHLKWFKENQKRERALIDQRRAYAAHYRNYHNYG